MTTQFNSVLYLFAYSAAQEPIIKKERKKGRKKERKKKERKKTITYKQKTKQDNFNHLENNNNPISESYQLLRGE
jgi:hypothetical protein